MNFVPSDINGNILSDITYILRWSWGDQLYYVEKT